MHLWFILVFKKDSAKTVSVHPLRKEWFVCGSSYGKCCLFDIRGKMGNRKGELQPLASFEGHTRSVYSAFLSPVTGQKLVTVCNDDRIRIFDVGESKRPPKVIKHNNHTGRWLTTFKVKSENDRKCIGCKIRLPDYHVTKRYPYFLTFPPGWMAPSKRRLVFRWIIESTTANRCVFEYWKKVPFVARGASGYCLLYRKMPSNKGNCSRLR